MEVGAIGAIGVALFVLFKTYVCEKKKKYVFFFFLYRMFDLRTFFWRQWSHLAPASIHIINPLSNTMDYLHNKGMTLSLLIESRSNSFYRDKVHVCCISS
jgi:hypothetical protein